MEDEFIAHRRDGNGESQPLERHLRGVGAIASRNASKITYAGEGNNSANLEATGELLGLLHDIGKYSKEFQCYIKSATGLIDEDAADFVDADKLKGRIDHSTAGAQFVWNELSKAGPIGAFVGQILALCLASHHSGLIDCLSPDPTDVFTKRICKEESRSHAAEAVDKVDPEIKERLAELLHGKEVVHSLDGLIRRMVKRKADFGEQGQILQFKIGLLVRLLFSCLVDADRVDTADFERPHAATLRGSGNYQEWRNLRDQLEAHLKSLKDDKPVDSLRKQVSENCRFAADRRKGIFTLTVPTGGGKTLASLRFAIHHAKKHKLDRIIYVIPFTSIIDQNADVVRKIFEPAGSGIDPGNVVLEHHSNLTDDERSWRSKVLSENWDAPIVFTTSVQLLEALFDSGTRGARRMHQLARSVIIFDEVQTLPLSCVHMFNNAINFLVENCGCSVVLCTATQPLLNGVDATKGSAAFAASDEIIPNIAELFVALKRTQIIPKIKPEGWTDDDVATLAVKEIGEDTTASSGSCLVIVNTRNAARSLYQKCALGAKAKKFHLSTAMCPAHRRAKFEEIRERLRVGQPTLCVSTQLIEAGVDVDFGTVIRHVAGLDSIAQAAGRCNRNGSREIGNVYVINPADDRLGRLEDIRIGRDVALRILSDYESDPSTFAHDLIGPVALNQYFEYYFYQRAKDMSYHVPPKEALRDDTLLNLLSENKLAVDEYKQLNRTGPSIRLRQAFMTAGKAFRVIDAPTKGVLVPYLRGAEIINELCANQNPEIQYRLLREAQQYSVNVFPNVFERLQDDGALTEIGDAVGIYHLHPTYYSEEFGLSDSRVAEMEAIYG
jgi:CRISPR-associated endonuclease/helicase Cas3